MNFDATISGGKLEISTPEKWKDYLLTFTDGTRMVVDLSRRKNKRSISQNSYYWLYLGVIENETGNLADDMHEYFKRKFLPPKEKRMVLNGVRRKFMIPGSTATLDKFDFGQYLDKICAETGVPLPDVEAAGFISNHKGYLS
jgi:hypothetical protein